jgi:hypothetical protein
MNSSAIKAVQALLGIDEGDAISLINKSLPEVFRIVRTLQTQHCINPDTETLLHKLNNALAYIGAVDLQQSVKRFEMDVHRAQIQYNTAMPDFYQIRLRQLINQASAYLKRFDNV